MKAARGDRAAFVAILLSGIVVATMAGATSLAFAQAVAPDQITIDGDAISTSLTGAPGDAQRGRAVIASRQAGLCLLCHSGPFPEEKFQGTIAPSLAGAGSRLNEAQLRLRIVDATRANPATLMPSYYRIEGLTRVAANVRDKPILTAAQIEDVVAFLSQLKD